MEATEKRGVDRISEVDFGGNLATTLAVMQRELRHRHLRLARGGRADGCPSIPCLFANIVVRFIQCYADPGRAAGRRQPRSHALVARRAGCVHPAPKILPLADIARAHELVESGAVIGKVMVSV